MNRVSVLISSWNNSSQLHRALQTVKVQSVKPHEVILIDDASVPAEASRIYEISKEFKNTGISIRFHRNQKNLGLTKSLNVGISMSSGDCFARLDCDDQYLPRRIETAIKAFEKGHHFVASPKASLFERRFIHLSYRRELHCQHIKKRLEACRHVAPHSGFAFTKFLVNKLGGYDETFIYAQDFEFLYRVVADREIGKTAMISKRGDVVLGVEPGAISSGPNRAKQFSFMLFALICHNEKLNLCPAKYERFTAELGKNKIANQLLQLQIDKSKIRQFKKSRLAGYLALRPKLLLEIINERSKSRQLTQNNQLISALKN